MKDAHAVLEGIRLRVAELEPGLYFRSLEEQVTALLEFISTLERKTEGECDEHAEKIKELEHEVEFLEDKLRDAENFETKYRELAEHITGIAEKVKK